MTNHLETVLAQHIKRHAARIATGEEPVATETETVGRFVTVAGATVRVDLEIGMGRVGEFTVSAYCGGFGCPDARHRVDSYSSWAIDPAEASAAASTAAPLIRQVSRWAQSHAETCRALPKPGSAA